MLKAIVYVLLPLIGAAYFADCFFARGDSPRAPPRLKPRIPLIGHGICILIFGTSYLRTLWTKHTDEIFTLGLFNIRVFLVNSRRLIPLIQRQSSIFSFQPFFRYTAKMFVNCSDYTVQLHDDPDFIREISKVNKESMWPGPHLDHQNLRTVNSLKELFENSFKLEDPVLMSPYAVSSGKLSQVLQLTECSARTIRSDAIWLRKTSGEFTACAACQSGLRISADIFKGSGRKACAS